MKRVSVAAKGYRKISRPGRGWESGWRGLLSLRKPIICGAGKFENCLL